MARFFHSRSFIDRSDSVLLFTWVESMNETVVGGTGSIVYERFQVKIPYNVLEISRVPHD